MNIELSDYLLKHHFKEIAEGDADDVKAAALQVIKAQDAALEEAREIIENARSFALSERYPAKEESAWLAKYPASPK